MAKLCDQRPRAPRVGGDHDVVALGDERTVRGEVPPPAHRVREFLLAPQPTPRDAGRAKGAQKLGARGQHWVCEPVLGTEHRDAVQLELEPVAAGKLSHLLRVEVG